LASMARGSGYWLSVNASSVSLVNSRSFHSLVASAPMPIVIELNEPNTIDADAALRHAAHSLPTNAMLGLQQMGLDHASLSIVSNLRPNFVKLDQSLTRELDQDPARRAQLTTMIGLAKQISAEVIASGIENERELAVLYELGVRYGQGFLLGRPQRLTQPV
jgi:EAL domain-containing protein (putative c-di-GMP-specific phosphodiesterase class I)